MTNVFVLSGIIQNVVIPDKEKPSALILLQYGPTRERQGNRPVEFINAVPIRVPAMRLERIRDRLEVGARVSVTGRQQGVLKGVMSDGFITTELVADRVNFEEPFETAADAE